VTFQVTNRSLGVQSVAELTSRSWPLALSAHADNVVVVPARLLVWLALIA
jgi:hypothetical protein